MDGLEPIQGVRRKRLATERNGSPRPEKVQVLEQEKQGKASLETVPPEVIENIGSHLLSNPDLSGGNKDDSNLMLSNRYMRNSLMGEPPANNPKASSSEFTGGPPTLKLRRISNRFAKAAQDTFADIVPPDSFIESVSYGLPIGGRGNECIATHDTIDAVGLLLPYQNDVAIDDLVGQVLLIRDEEVKGETINSLSHFAKDLSRSNIDDLTGDAIALFAADDLSTVTYGSGLGLKALVRLGNQKLVSEKNVDDIHHLLNTNPQLELRLSEARSQVDIEDARIVSLSSAPDAERPLPALERLRELEQQRRSVVEAEIYDEYEHLKITTKIGQELPALEKRAREELLTSVRDRSGRAG